MKFSFFKMIGLLICLLTLSSFSEEANYKYNIIKEISTMEEIQDNFLNSEITKIVNDETKENIEFSNENTENNIQEEKFTDTINFIEEKNGPEIEATNSQQFQFSTNTTSDSIQNNNKTSKTETKETTIREERNQEINDRSNRVTALGSAMGAVDLGSTPAKKIRLGAGVGNSSSSQAIAVGVGYAPTENFRVNTKFSSSTNNVNNNSISVGASYDLDI